MSTERTIRCTGTVRAKGGPLMFNIRVHVDGATSDYVLELDEAIKLRRELTDFLAMQNVPANF
jgi:hypothetical protein